MTNDLEFALALADVADEITRAGFDAGSYTTRIKDDGSPVTDVDVGVENALAAAVTTAHPDDGFLSEELGARGHASRTWIVDGIDGTAEFARGGSLWGTLVALEEDGEIVLGVASSPGLGRRWWARRGTGAWTRALSEIPPPSSAIRLRVSRGGRQPRGVVLPPAGVLRGWRDEAVRRARYALRPAEVLGAAGPLLVAGGEVDVSVHLAGGPWDHAPFVVLVEEAGGRFSDLWGGRRIDTGTAIFSNGVVHERVRTDVAGSFRPPIYQ